MGDLHFHILDVKDRDEIVVSEDEDMKAVEYESGVEEESEPEEVQRGAKKGRGYINPDARLVVHLFGSTADGKSVRVDCKGFEPFFFVRIHEEKYAKQGPACLRSYLMKSMNLSAGSPVFRLIKFKLVWRKLMYGYTGGKEFPFVEVKVPSLQLFREIRKQFLNDKQEPFLKYPQALDRPFQKGVAPKIYEANLDPYLRFMHLRNLKPCDWCTVKGGLDMVEEGGGAYTIDDCNWEDVGPCSAPPAPTAPFRVASWDIECYSASGDFPVALNGDPVIQIGTVLSTLGSKDNEKHVFVLDTCDTIEGATVHSFKTEAGLLKGWFDWIVKRDVDILIGYNIFGFDEQYVWHRCEKLKLTNVESIQQLTRLSDYGGDMLLEEKRLSSSAMGDNFLHLWNTTGRLRIDLYHAIKRQYQMGSYKLDDTSRAFLNDSVKKVLVAKGEQWCIEVSAQSIQKQGAMTGRALVLLNDAGDSLCEKCTITEVVVVGDGSNKISFSAPMDVDEADVSKWAIVKDDLSPQDMFKKQKGSSTDRAVIAEYCIQDCQLVLDMFRKLDTFNNAASMANVCSVPVAHIFLRGQGIKIESLIFKYCYENNLAIEVMPSPGFRDVAVDGEGGGASTESYEGAIVLDPVPGLYTVPVGVADFASLYPSTIISENISHDTLVSVMDYSLDGVLVKESWGQEFNEWNTPESIAFTDIEFDIWGADPEDKRKNPEKIKTGIRVCRYAQDKQGAIPIIIAQLLDARKKTRALIKTEADPFRKALLDSQQNAYKITANSLYGQLGSGTFKIRLQNLAASVTAYGRKQIMFAKAAIEKFYGPGSGNPKCCCEQVKTVYGDSVAADTLLVVKLSDGIVVRTTFESIAGLYGNSWAPCYETRSRYCIQRTDKESCYTPGLQTLTEKGWTYVYRIIRHSLPAGKRMLRVHYKATVGTDNSRYIDVTNDHSMLLSNGKEIKPSELKVDDKLCCNNKHYELHVTSVTEIHDYTGYVYDMTTENHHFQAGGLGLVVHNTDSLFIAFHPKDPATGKELEGEESMRATIELTEEAGKLVTQALKAPHDFEFDKVYWPFLIFSKKRYVGHKYEDPDHYALTSMGIALKRRDYAPIVKKIYGGAIHILLTEKNVAKAAEFVRTSCRELIEGKYGLGPLTITKSLRAEYSDPTRIAHKVLADRITLRSPGNAPAAGDRIGYVYVQPTPGQIASDLQGDRIETPAYIREKGLKPDYMFYIDHQISSPVCQVFGLLIEQIPGYVPRVWSEDSARQAKEREAYAYDLLFQDAIAVNNNSAKRRFVQLFGGSGIAVPPASSSNRTRHMAVTPIVSKKPLVGKAQSSLDSFLADTVRISAHKASMKKKKDGDK
jgi:DNA polymerase elongation subunit (family B)